MNLKKAQMLGDACSKVLSGQPLTEGEDAILEEMAASSPEGLLFNPKVFTKEGLMALRTMFSYLSAETKDILCACLTLAVYGGTAQALKTELHLLGNTLGDTMCRCNDLGLFTEEELIRVGHAETMLRDVSHYQERIDALEKAEATLAGFGYTFKTKTAQLTTKKGGRPAPFLSKVIVEIFQKKFKFSDGNSGEMRTEIKSITSAILFADNWDRVIAASLNRYLRSENDARKARRKKNCKPLPTV